MGKQSGADHLGWLGMGERITPRYMRRLEGAPRLVQAVWGGPPSISLENRAELLVALRNRLAEYGLEVCRIRGGLWPAHRVLAEGEGALDVLQRDERCADARNHWWIDDAIWETTSGDTTIAYWADPDGYDLLFLGWGPVSTSCLGALLRVLTEDGFSSA